MAVHGLFNASDLVPLLAERGITLSAVQVWRLVTQTPEWPSLPVLAALCDIFEVTPAQLIAPGPRTRPQRRRPRTAGRAAGRTAGRTWLIWQRFDRSGRGCAPNHDINTGGGGAARRGAATPPATKTPDRGRAPRRRMPPTMTSAAIA